MKYLLALLFVMITSIAVADDLIHSGNLIYSGSFKVATDNDPCGVGYGGHYLGLNQAGNGLYISGIWTCGAKFSEQAIPVAKCLNASGTAVSCIDYSMPSTWITNVSALNRATLTQPFTDLTFGNLYNAAVPPITGTMMIATGIISYNGKLYGGTKGTFDANGTQDWANFTANPDFSINDFEGYWKLDDGLFAGFDGGPMAKVPTAYQAQIGYPLIGGQGSGVSIAPSASYGPCLIGYDPEDFIEANQPPNTVPATPLIYYPQGGLQLPPGNYYMNEAPQSPYISPGDRIGGVVFPENSRSVLYFGTHGRTDIDGTGCYGPGTSGPDGSGDSELARAYSDGCPGGVGNCDYTKRIRSIEGNLASGTFIIGETVVQNNTNASVVLIRVDTVFGLSFLSNTLPGSANEIDSWVGQTSRAVWTTGANTYITPICYDPEAPAKGPHNWPYVSYVWAYDVGDASGNNTTGNTVQSQNSTYPGKNNITAVKLGQIAHDEIVPHAVWPLRLPTSTSTTTETKHMSGAVYDSESGKIYVSQLSAYGGEPLIHVFQLGEGVAPTCSDGMQNGDETGVDCGGSCSACTVNPTCSDGIRNGTETGIDCGGSCSACPGGGGAGLGAGTGRLSTGTGRLSW